MSNRNDDGAGCVSAIIMFLMMFGWLYLLTSDSNLCRKQNLEARAAVIGAFCVDKTTGAVTSPRPEAK